MSANALELNGLSSGYGEAVVVRDVELTIRPGEIFALLGKNGMGKSTLRQNMLAADLAAGVASGFEQQMAM